MSRNIRFALNHITTPQLTSRQFIDLAADLGCDGIELRNDLADKKLNERPFFDGENPAEIGAYANEKGVALLGLSEAYGFNHWTDAMEQKIATLISEALASGAQSISLIPSNDGQHGDDATRLKNLEYALAKVLEMLDSTDLIALVEPLGFTTSSLRKKAEAVAAIKSIGGEDRFKLVHDTFHHHLAAETEFFPEFTGIVHISGVVDPSLTTDQMQDAHRILVDDRDRLGNLEQIDALLKLGYSGAFSFEPFSPLVHASEDPEGELRQSMDFIRARLN